MRSKSRLIALLALGALSSFPLLAADKHPPDNTGTNQRDRDQGAQTADQQSNDKSDVQVTAQIRRAIVDDSALSVTAHNVKIVTRKGAVTLKGPVLSAAEKKTVEGKAAGIAGDANVTSELEVKEPAAK